MYIDDYLSGCDTIEEAKILKQEVSTILSRGGFNLTKWSSNNANVLENNETIINTQSISLNMEGQLKTLGLFWDCKSNTLNYKAQIGNPKLTKRGILSSISKIFDPLGLLSPIVIKSKMLLQEMWKNKLRWDEPISHEIQQAWLNLTKDLNELNDIKIPRKVVPAAGAKIELHGFCDASQKAYGAVIYLKTIYENKVTTQLLVSKSRVAPLKMLTIPRLELAAAVLLAQLINRTQEILHIKIDAIYLHSDSSIVLAWLAQTPTVCKTFVANRVEQIQSLTKNAIWAHVSTHMNPADLISRGTTTEKLINNALWWEGPTFIKNLQTLLSNDNNSNYLPTQLPDLGTNVTKNL